MTNLDWISDLYLRLMVERDEVGNGPLRNLRLESALATAAAILAKLQPDRETHWRSLCTEHGKCATQIEHQIGGGT